MNARTRALNLLSLSLTKHVRELQRCRGLPIALVVTRRIVALTAAPPVTNPVLLASRHNLLAAALLAEYRLVEAIDLLDDALVALSFVRRPGRDIDELRASIIAKLGAARLLGGDSREGMRLIEAAVPHLTNEDDRAEALLDLALANMKLASFDVAEQLAGEALALASLPRQMRNANHLLGEICRRTGRYEEAGRHLDIVAGFYPGFENARELIGSADLYTDVNWKR